MHGVVCRLNCVIHVWALWGRDACHLGRYINPRTLFSYWHTEQFLTKLDGEDSEVSAEMFLFYFNCALTQPDATWAFGIKIIRFFFGGGRGKLEANAVWPVLPMYRFITFCYPSYVLHATVPNIKLDFIASLYTTGLLVSPHCHTIVSTLPASRDHTRHPINTGVLSNTAPGSPPSPITAGSSS